MKTESERSQEIEQLLADSNWLAAITLARQTNNDEAENAVLVGQIITALLGALEVARKKDEFETQRFLRAMLSYCLRDYPGLSALYREQCKMQATPVQSVESFVQGIGDVLSGKTSVDAKIREGVEEAQHRVEEVGAPLSDFIKTMESSISSGLKDLSDMIANLSVQKDPTKPREDRESDLSAEQEDGSTIKVNIENANDSDTDD
jgi:hypothetical protein